MSLVQINRLGAFDADEIAGARARKDDPSTLPREPRHGYGVVDAAARAFVEPVAGTIDGWQLPQRSSTRSG